MLKRPYLQGCLAPAVTVLVLAMTVGCGQRPDVESFILLNRAARDVERLRADLDAAAPVTTSAHMRAQRASGLKTIAGELAAHTHPVMFQPVAELLDRSISDLEAAFAAAPRSSAEAAALSSYRTNQTQFVVYITALAPRSERAPRTPGKQRKLSREERDLGAALAIAPHAPAEAVQKLIPLAQETRNTPLGATISLTLARLLSRFETRAALPADMQPPPMDLALSELEAIFSQECYSPALFEGFLRWRTLQQMFRFGIHRDSPIPNEQYNATRNRLIEQIRTHLRRHPRDAHAWSQLQGLCLCPNIIRTSLGNSATEDDRMLNPQIAKKESNATQLH